MRVKVGYLEVSSTRPASQLLPTDLEVKLRGLPMLDLYGLDIVVRKKEAVRVFMEFSPSEE